MNRDNILTALFFLMAGLFMYLFYRLMAPFIIPIAWAAILAIIFYPLYRRLGRRLKSENWSAFIMTLVIFFLVVGPAFYFLAALVGEATDAFNWINNLYESGQIKAYMNRVAPFMEGLRQKVLVVYPDLANINFDSLIKDIIGTVSGTVGSKATAILANLTKTVFQFFLTMFAIFFFLRDGEKLIANLKKLTPLSSEQSGPIYSYLKEVIKGTMYGGLVMALIQGTLGGILFAIMGINAPVFWGAVMGFLSFLPVVGPFLIYIPAGIILMLGGSVVKGIITIAIGTGVISQIDNFVRPLLFRGKTGMHTLLLFFSIMGGVVFFGLVGVVLGPVIAAVFMTILKIIETRMHPAPEKAADIENAES